MYICNGTTIWGFIFKIIEISIISILAYIFTRNYIEIRRNNEFQSYEKMDLIILLLSIFQIYLMFLSIILTNNYGFSILQELSKFTQNFIIAGCLFLQIFLWQKNSFAVYIVKNYNLILILYNVIILFSSFIFEYSFNELNFCYSLILKILPSIAFALNAFVISLTIYNNYQEQQESNDTGLLLENDNLNNIIHKFKSSLQRSRKYYLIFILSFTISFFVDIFFKFSSVSVSVNSNKFKDEIYLYSSKQIKDRDFNYKIYDENENENIRKRILNVLNNNIIDINSIDYIDNNNYDFTSYDKNSIKKINNNENFRKDLEFLFKKIDKNNNNDSNTEKSTFNSKIKENKINIYSYKTENNNISNAENLNNSNSLNNLNVNNSNLNYSNSTSNITLTKIIKNINGCIYYKNLGDNYSFKEMLVCFIYFFFRDIGPQIYIYISFFKFKHESISRTSSFIEV
jgi:hypothetical protein